MRKKFYKGKKPTASTKKVKPRLIMTEGMSKVNRDFYGNMDRLESEWNLCCDQYDVAKEQSLTKDSNFDARMIIRKISTYWNSRKLALERALDDDAMKKFVDKRAEQNKKNEKD